ncbi:hypothetical protein [Bradyrhizobium sp. USDA 4451]
MVVEDAIVIHPDEAATVLAPGLVVTTSCIGLFCRAVSGGLALSSHPVLTLAQIGPLTRFALARDMDAGDCPCLRRPACWSRLNWWSNSLNDSRGRHAQRMIPRQLPHQTGCAGSPY